MDNNTNNRNIVVYQDKATNAVQYTDTDLRLVKALEERLLQSNSLDEYKESWEFMNTVKKQTVQLHFDTQTQLVNLNKQKTDLMLYKIQKGISISLGLGLFVASFFVFAVNPVIGGIFFGTGLGALGIGTISIKSLLNK